MASIYEPPGSVQAPSLYPSWWQRDASGNAMTPTFGGPGGQMSKGITGWQAYDPNAQTTAWSARVGPDNVYASQGAGVQGFSWDPNQASQQSLMSRSLQQGAMDMQGMQRQQDLARAAYMRATPTPGGMQAYGDQQAQRWQQMMQGLQGMWQQQPQQAPRGNRF
jgi:hypothetical protein